MKIMDVQELESGCWRTCEECEWSNWDVVIKQDEELECFHCWRKYVANVCE